MTRRRIKDVKIDQKYQATNSSGEDGNNKQEHPSDKTVEVSEIFFSGIEMAVRYFKLELLLKETSELIDKDPTFSSDVRREFNTCHRRILTAISQHDCDLVPLPTSAPEIWINREDRSETPAVFINRVYKSWLRQEGEISSLRILAHSMTMSKLRHLDETLYITYARWKNTFKDKRDDIFLPTRNQVTDLGIKLQWASEEALQEEAREATRSASTLKRRRRRISLTK